MLWCSSHRGFKNLARGGGGAKSDRGQMADASGGAEMVEEGMHAQLPTKDDGRTGSEGRCFGDPVAKGALLTTWGSKEQRSSFLVGCGRRVVIRSKFRGRAIFDWQNTMTEEGPWSHPTHANTVHDMVSS